MSALPQAIASNPHTNLLNVYIYIYRLQIKLGFNKKKWEVPKQYSHTIMEYEELTSSKTCKKVEASRRQN
jgi:hypothetical protein